MKADLAPKHSIDIDSETQILWFSKSNNYVIVSNELSRLLDKYLKAPNKTQFIADEDGAAINTRIENLYEDLSHFLEDANTPDIEPPEIVIDDLPTLPLHQYYAFDEQIVRINFQSELIAQIIHPLIAHHASRPSTGEKVAFNIFRADHHLFLFRNDKQLGSYKTIDFHLLQGKFALELANVIHDKHRDRWLATFHASTISNGQEAIMIVGDSGSGKSTLSALLMTQNLELLADDFTPMHDDTQLYSYPAAISVKQNAFNILASKIEGFQSLPVHTNGPKKVNLKYVPPTHQFKRAGYPCHTIVKVKFDKNHPSSFKQIPTATLLEALIPDSWISPNDTHASKFLDWTKTLQCYELCYSDNDFAMANFKQLFKS